MSINIDAYPTQALYDLTKSEVAILASLPFIKNLQPLVVGGQLGVQYDELSDPERRHVATALNDFERFQVGYTQLFVTVQPQ